MNIEGVSLNSTSSPKYITAISSEICLTTDKSCAINSIVRFTRINSSGGSLSYTSSVKTSSSTCNIHTLTLHNSLIDTIRNRMLCHGKGVCGGPKRNPICKCNPGTGGRWCEL